MTTKKQKSQRRRRSTKPKKSLYQTAHMRFMFMVAIMGIWALVLGVRLVQLQVYQHDELRSKSQNRRGREAVVVPTRGQIMDRNGRVLAISVPYKILAADATKIPDPAVAAKDISKVLGINAASLEQRIRAAKESNQNDLELARDLDQEMVQAINRDLVMPNLGKTDLPKYTGLAWKTASRRTYPHGTTAAHVIGHMKDNDGAAGIERSQQNLLGLQPVTRQWSRDKFGNPYGDVTDLNESASDVVLTIDLAIQNIAEDAIKRAVESSKARSGVAIVANPKNGEILAMANYPTFDPNRITSTTKVHTKNLAIETLYDPGSVFKVVTYGAGLEKGDFKPEDEIELGDGSVSIGGRTLKAKGGRMTYSQGLATSNNACAVKAGVRVGNDGLFAMAQKMGFGTRTGIELPAEVRGILAPPASWSPAAIISKSIGYENSASPLQILGAFATIANDGKSFHPHVVKEVRHSYDKPKDVTQVQHTQLFTAETARNLKTMLKHVVTAGTAKRAQLDGYSAAGKTGTAWKYDAKNGSASGQKLISSFVGMTPVESPELVIAVVLDEPADGGRDAGYVAAPVFSEIAQASLKHLNVTPDQPGIPKAGIVETKPADASNASNSSVGKKPGETKPANAETKKNEKNAEPETKQKPKPTNAEPLKKPTPGRITAQLTPFMANRPRMDS